MNNKKNEITKKNEIIDKKDIIGNKQGLEKEEFIEETIKENIIGKIAKIFVNRFELTMLLIVLVGIIGVSSYFLLPKESLPEIVFPSLTIQTIYPGASSVDVEQLVTTPLEARLSSVDNVTDVVSSSSFGFSFINVSFEEDVDMELVKLQVDNLLAETNLPDGAFEPKSSIFKTSEIPLISMSLTGDKDIFELTEYANALKTEIEGVSGVESVNVIGGSTREIQVELDFEKMENLGISFNQVVSLLQGVNVSIPIGEIEQGSERLNIRLDETISEIDELENLLVSTNGIEPILLKDVAIVVDGNKEVTQFNRTFTTESGLANSVFISVIRENQSDVLTTSNLVKETVANASGTAYPTDVTVTTSSDTATSVKEDLDNITGNALSGLLVVILVLFLFIGFREAIIVSISIPLTLLGTLGVLNFIGITLNTFAILGLIVALGLLVDNTIIVMENMDRLAIKGFSRDKAAIIGTNQVGYPISAATLTTVAAFLPLAILPGIIGAFINTIPRTIIITLVVSLLMAITVTPSVYTFVYRRFDRRQAKKSKLKKVNNNSFAVKIKAAIVNIKTRFSNIYEGFIVKVISSKLRMASVLLLVVAILASSVMLIVNGNLKIAFFPETEPTSLTVNVDVPSGKTLTETSRIVAEVEFILANSDEVQQFNTTIGGNEADLGVIRVDLAESEKSGFEKLESIEAALASVEGAKITIETVSAGGPPVGKAISVQIFGENLEESTIVMNQYLEKLEALEGSTNVESNLKSGSNVLVFDIDTTQASSLGLSPAYIGLYLRQVYEGQVATSINQEGNLVDVKVTYDVNSLADPLALSIATPFGETIRLSELVDVEETASVSSIWHEEGNRVITVSSDLANGYNSTESLNLFKESVADIVIPESVTISYGGDAAGISENFLSLFQSMIIAMFLVFMILTVQFKSIKQPFAIILTVPMALIGVLYGLYITGNEFGFYAFMALVSLVGIAVNDAIVLIDYMNFLREKGYSLYKAIGEATKTRFNPVLATTLTTIGGILPLAFRNQYYSQFGYALVFGLLVTTLMTLILIPIMYSLLEGKETRREEKSQRNTIHQNEDDQDKSSEEKSGHDKHNQGERKHRMPKEKVGLVTSMLTLFR